MTQINKAPAKKRSDARAARAVNPYLDTDLHTRMRDYTEREAAVAKELRAIAERGASRRHPDPRFAPSLESILGIVKKGLPLSEMFARIALGTEKALWQPWMTAYGFELRSVNYAATGARNACLALDLGAGSKANAVFAKAGVANWRSCAAEDCAQLHIVPANGKTQASAVAIYYLDPESK